MLVEYMISLGGGLTNILDEFLFGWRVRNISSITMMLMCFLEVINFDF